jgi:hypothetical protein
MHKYSRKNPGSKFWDRVNKTDNCWIWRGYRHQSHHYGTLKVFKKRTYAHRYAWELTYGKIPNEMHVLHHCDNPPCVRPNHLFLGTQADNNRDKKQKGRLVFGSKRKLAKLKESDIPIIRELWKRGQSMQQIALVHGVHRNTIQQVLSSKTWKHVC